MKRIAAILILPLLCAPPLTAQDGRLAGRLSPDAEAAVMALADSAHALSLPGELVVQKALEGVSKGAPVPVILDVVRGLVRDLARARNALGGEASPELLQLGAAALDAGVPPEELARLRRHRARRGFRSALVGLVYLRSRGVASELAVATVDSMLDADLPAAGFTALQRLVERDVRVGIPSSEATRVRANALVRHGGRLGPDGGR